MAVIYLRSTDGSDASDGLTWANAKATLAAALTAAGAGGTVYVSDNHAETQASSMTLVSPGTDSSPVTVLCVSDTSDPEPPTALATTATVSTTGSGSISYSGFAYCYGVTFNHGDSTNNASVNFTSTAHWWWRLEECALVIVGSGTNSRVSVGANSTIADDQLLELINTDLQFANASQGVVTRCPLVWRGGAVTGSTFPTTLFLSPTSGISGPTSCRDIDLANLGSGNNLVDIGQANLNSYYFENCKLGSSVSVATGTVDGQGGTNVRLVNCDSADTNYRYHKQNYQGTITHETTIVRTGGASDGTTGISRKMATTANSKFYSPLESDPILIWNETTGSSVTATVEVVTDNVTLTDAEAWIEVEYLGTTGFPLSLTASDRAADILATGANQTSSSVTWTTTGLTTPVKQKLSVAFTPQEKGPIKVRVMLAKASTTMYFCPKVDIT